MARHPHRLPLDQYRGFYCYFLTASTYGRRASFRDPALCGKVTTQLFQSTQKHGFAVIAYCLMPDHVHVLVEAEQPDADFRKWLGLWRQLSGFWERRRTGQYLWQEGYWDYTLRDDDSVIGIAAYVVANPVRAGLVRSPEQYPYLGSSRYSLTELMAAVQQRPRGASDG
ncbi:MAG: transposase [Acidobacteriota bacterium]|nr:transposase [Acidobacteriota bacterium]